MLEPSMSQCNCQVICITFAVEDFSLCSLHFSTLFRFDMQRASWGALICGLTLSDLMRVYPSGVANDEAAA